MKSIHSKAFSDIWHALYHDTNPQLGKDRWHVDGVDWIRETHSYFGRDYSFRMECHRLCHGADSESSWSLLAVVERWWGLDRARAIRTSEWRQVVSGQQKEILAWFAKQKRRVERRRSSMQP